MVLDLVHVFDLGVVYKISQVFPLEEITIKVLHLNHACQLEPDENGLEAPNGTTVGGLKEQLLEVSLFFWLECR